VLDHQFCQILFWCRQCIVSIQSCVCLRDDSRSLCLFL